MHEVPPTATEGTAADEVPHGSLRGWKLVARRVQRAFTANLLLKTISFAIALALYAYFHRTSAAPPGTAPQATSSRAPEVRH